MPCRIMVESVHLAPIGSPCHLRGCMACSTGNIPPSLEFQLPQPMLYFCQLEIFPGKSLGRRFVDFRSASGNEWFGRGSEIGNFFLLKLFFAIYFPKNSQLFFGGSKRILRDEESPNVTKTNGLTDHQLLESQKNLACGGLACSRCYDSIRYGSDKL